MNAFLQILKDFIQQFAPAIAVALWNYEEDKVQKAKDEALDAHIAHRVDQNALKNTRDKFGKYWRNPSTKHLLELWYI